jgi:hypothetical protein
MPNKPPHHVVVDGSNIATEGRSMPSLQQLDEAVRAYIEVEPDALITVVVDATFGHRIDAKEVAGFDAAVAANELVAPPAGAVGRGDAFVLSIADKVKATILSNDSFQEFHGQYPWLFDEGRLVGGKPVPHIGWVFVNRVPVRGPLSRKSVADSKRKGRRSASQNEVRTGSPEANLPMPVPSAPPPGAVLPKKEQPPKEQPPKMAAAEAKPAPKASEVNELIPFLTFVEHHPPGTSVSAMVDSYSSHGAYVTIGDVRGYVPLRLMADPAPRSAREFMKVGESVTLVVESFAPARRSIDLAVPAMATAKLPAPKPAKRTKKAAAEEAPSPAPAKRSRKAAPAIDDVVTVVTAPEGVAAVEAAAPRRRSRKAADVVVEAPDAVVEAPPPAEPASPKPARRSAKRAAPETEAAPAEPTPKPRKRAAKSAAPVVVEPAAPVEEPAAPAKRTRKKAAAPTT